VDLSTVDRDRLDYARILIATSSLDIIHSATDVLIDEELVNIKIVEEWGFSIGEDVCLFEEESVIDANDNVEKNVNLIENNDGRDGDLVENLVNDISKEFMEKERSSCQSDEQIVVPKATMGVQQHFQAMDKDEDLNVTPPLCHVSRDVDDNNLMAATIPFQCDEINKTAEAGNGNSIINDDGSVPSGKVNFIGQRGDDGAVVKRKPSIRTTSCPPSRERPMVAGPWSLEWLGDVNHGEAIFASRKKSKKKPSISQGQQSKNKDGQITKKKLDGVLRHPGGV
jgi:hypothetical protein